MSGVAAVVALLRANAGVTAVAPAASIFAGDAPKSTLPPLITVHEVSRTERLTASMGETARLMTERVQVTVDAASYPQKKQLLKLVRSAVVVMNTTVNGVSVLAILPDMVGPDDDDEIGRIYSQSWDFFVRWRATPPA